MSNGKIPYAGKERQRVDAIYGRACSKETVRIEYRIPVEMLDALNAGFIADPSAVTFADYMRKLNLYALRKLKDELPNF